MAAAAAPQDYDSRLLGRPSTFDGTETSWGDWNFQTRAYLETLHPEMGDVLDLAESSGAALPLSSLTTENKALSRQIFYVLVNLLKGPATLELRRCERGNGLECWRLLCQRYEQATTSRLAAMLNSILRPTPFAQDALGFETVLKDWELQVSKWESMASDLLNDAVKRQVLQEQALDMSGSG